MKYILSIDAGTTGITILLINSKLMIIDKEYSEFNQIYPNPGWVEHDPIEIWEVTLNLINIILKRNNNIAISCIGITNQRETTVMWNKHNGKPIYNAIVWQDKRTNDICNNIINKGHSSIINKKTGLVIDSYFSATKIKWIIDNVDDVPDAIKNNKILFGTIDTWLLWKLTGDQIHKTDYTNASRTLIFNIESKSWDNDLLGLFDIPKSLLPEVCCSSHIFGFTDEKIVKDRIPISGIAGDQQSALFGQFGFNIGDIKTTYGTGCFTLLNTGDKKIISKNGILTTLACDFNGNPVYALEGSVFIGGAVIQWLRDEMQIIENAEITEKFAKSVNSTKGVYIVPAFAGLGAPYWDMDAKGLICGLTRGVNKKHIVRAALESIAYQVEDLLSSLKNDMQFDLKIMNVDGGASKNNFLMQFQSNISNVSISKPANIESTALGAAMLAGIKLKIWSSREDILRYKSQEYLFKPNLKSNKRKDLMTGWKKAINRTKSI